MTLQKNKSLETQIKKDSDITKKQLDEWGCKYNELSVGEKPHFDLLIDDKSMRIEEIMVEDEIFE